MSPRPETIVLIHGLWMTPRSWEHWVEHYRRHGFDVLAPGYPGFEGEVEALRADPTPIEVLTIEHIAHHYETIVRGLKNPPILMGHSFGGAVVQILLDRGLGAAGVVIDTAPIKGILKVPWTQVRSIWPVLKSPENRHRAVGFTYEQFRYAFTNNLTEAESRAAYDRYHIPAPGRLVFNAATQNFDPHAATRVDFDKEDRAPLLFIAGGEDHIMPASLNRANYERYRSGLVAFREYPDRAHFTAGQQGWEAVADFALDWALHPIAGTLQAPAGQERRAG